MTETGGCYGREDRKRKGAYKKIKIGDEDVRPAAGAAALYLPSESLEMFNCPLRSFSQASNIMSLSPFFLSPPVIFREVGRPLEMPVVGYKLLL